MADFAAVVRRFMQARGLSLRALARSANYDPSYLSKVLSGQKPVTPYLGACLDGAGVRSFAGSLLGDKESRRHADVVVTAGWLSALLAISATDLGDHPAALVWCTDTERRGNDAGHPELAGWAALTRALIAYYQGQAEQSASCAAQGQHVSAPGTVVHAKLAAQEMRSRAMLGDTAGIAEARRKATASAGAPRCARSSSHEPGSGSRRRS